MPSDGDDRLPFTCLVPGAPGVTDIYDQTAALRMAVVEREAVSGLGEDWDVPGAYILLDRPDTDGSWSAYVGKAPAGLKSRMPSHLRNRHQWCRVLLLQRDTTHGFNSAHAAWLEGRLHDLISASALGSLSNQQRPGDDTLAPYDRLMLETTIDPISRVLRLIGYETAPPDDEPPPQRRGRRTPARYTTTVADLLGAGLLQAGARLVSTYASTAADATVNPDGTITWDDGLTPHPPPLAARYAMGERPTAGRSGPSKPRTARSPWRPCEHATKDTAQAEILRTWKERLVANLRGTEWVILLVLLAFYFMPSFVAAARNHPRKAATFLLNPPSRMDGPGIGGCSQLVADRSSNDRSRYPAIRSAVPGTRRRERPPGQRSGAGSDRFRTGTSWCLTAAALGVTQPGQSRLLAPNRRHVCHSAVQGNLYSECRPGMHHQFQGGNQ